MNITSKIMDVVDNSTYMNNVDTNETTCKYDIIYKHIFITNTYLTSNSVPTGSVVDSRLACVFGINIILINLINISTTLI